MKPIGYCPNCGVFEGENCPCGEGKVLLPANKRVRVSKFMSGLLRHFGKEFGLQFDPEGWVDLKTFAEVVKRRHRVGIREIKLIAQTDPKRRFEINNGRIRTRYGHSIKGLKISWSEEGQIPQTLYHGSAPANLISILKEGLKPMKRLEVHMTDDPQEAMKVALRHHSNPVIFSIDVECLRRKNIEVRRKGKVYTCDRVPPECLKLYRW
jgi:putative RNA 2'-phosphotransferase